MKGGRKMAISPGYVDRKVHLYLLADSETGILIDIYFYWNPTEEQIRIAGEKLFS